MFYKILLSLVIATSLLASGCAKKQNPILDKGPNINASSLDVSLDGLNSEIINLKRDDPQFGPQINFTSQNNDETKVQSQRLHCGPKVIEGKNLNETDHPFSFRIAEEDFPGLNVLPKKLTCRLEVVFANITGSTATRQFPINILFDRHPTLEITRSPAVDSNVAVDPQNSFMLDSYQIKNTLDYAVGFVFRNTRQGTGQVFERRTNMPKGANYLLPPSGPQYPIRSVDGIKLTGDYINADGNHISDVKFLVKPGGTVNINTHATIPAALVHQTRTEPDVFSGFSTVYSYAGFNIKVSDTATPLVQWKGFEFSPDDLDQ
ncbi:MAG: hypothetical protein SGI74_00570 [Oligoflexia bacterium]|nr:hypothetical protein [Oligoflexia bacterium]